jgi:hypothetical protein
VLEAAGVEFTNGDEPGVKLRKHYTMITGARAVVYDPPEAGLPFIGVVLGRDGEVLIARSAASNAEAEALLATVMAHFSESVTKLKASKARKAK